MPRNVTFSQSRVVVARLALYLMRVTADVYLNEKRYGTASTETILCLAVIIGQLEGRRMSAGKLAAYAGMPRPTVIRKLASLMDRGLVGKHADGGFFLPREKLNMPAIETAVARITRTIHASSTALSKMDTSTIAD